MRQRQHHFTLEQCYFNPRIHKGCDLAGTRKPAENLYFNPRIHKGCDACSKPPTPLNKISIHASIKDATRQGIFRWFVRDYFNPRIHKGCDVQADQIATKVSNFNPRIHKGCDPILRRSLPHPPEISIHASIKDATQREQELQAVKKISIHASIKDAT